MATARRFEVYFSPCGEMGWNTSLGWAYAEQFVVSIRDEAGREYLPIVGSVYRLHGKNHADRNRLFRAIYSDCADAVVVDDDHPTGQLPVPAKAQFIANALNAASSHLGEAR